MLIRLKVLFVFKTIIPAVTLTTLIGLAGCATPPPTHHVEMSLAQAVSQAAPSSTPEFSDQQLAQRYAALLDRYREFQQASDSYFNTDGAVSHCHLSNDGKWLVTHGRSEAAIKAAQGRHSQQLKVRTDTTIQSASLLEGDCVNGIPEGPFVSVGEFLQSTKMKGVPAINNRSWVRIEGNASQGEMEGEFYSFSRSITDGKSGGGAGQGGIHLGVSSSQIESGKEIGTHLSIMGQPQTGMTNTMVREITQTPMGQQTQMHMYQGGTLLTSMMMLNDVPHGWMTYHGMPAGRQRSCMYHGELTDSAFCVAMAGAGDDTQSLPQEARKQLVRSDNGGAYLSPYTQDGVVAEWVNRAINANMGSAAGSAIGGAAGSYAANRALSSVPFGSMLGGMVGSRAGAAVGRDQAIARSGGEAFMRQTSDLSFDSLQNMATWLAYEYGQSSNFADVIKAANHVYPGLSAAVAGVR